MTEVTATDRLRHLLVRAYTAHYVTGGGIVKPRTASSIQIDRVVVDQLADFAVEFGVVEGYNAPASLLDALLTEAIERGEIVRTETGQLEHKLDYQLRDHSADRKC
ncbi:hypothetical protein PP568_17355 [Mycobacteroides abscessus]|uniref:Uncharacterized protein n=1 Tax=Mycobacteroides abscessus subsp. abscessus TaxID=1185650 RepID=A0AB38CWN7_9MYCO|nr:MULTISPECIES: hypothetical protein [Mycobacteriaceae]MBE5420825.1 hypothetical protein [Mycobacteroides abscessus]MBN7434271.1 hypothetical protein [Mycobacteroides abscessus subsp. abscessus]MBN7458788.1 hypothetical protein [Mycobacteroides abscessus subsp. abscessus]MBN7557485.1 hypothetical protein [Mycobacteroides abscessus subsp. abscessus]MDM2406980.1 hypothetical protein [Mycobacteroides abscessus]